MRCSSRPGAFSGGRKAISDTHMNIILGDGEKMADLMIQYRVGIEERDRNPTYMIDSEYFAEE